MPMCTMLELAILSAAMRINRCAQRQRQGAACTIKFEGKNSCGLICSQAAVCTMIKIPIRNGYRQPSIPILIDPSRIGRWKTKEEGGASGQHVCSLPLLRCSFLQAPHIPTQLQLTFPQLLLGFPLILQPSYS